MAAVKAWEAVSDVLQGKQPVTCACQLHVDLTHIFQLFTACSTHAPSAVCSVLRVCVHGCPYRRCASSSLCVGAFEGPALFQAGSSTGGCGSKLTSPCLRHATLAALGKGDEGWRIQVTSLAVVDASVMFTHLLACPTNKKKMLNMQIHARHCIREWFIEDERTSRQSTALLNNDAMACCTTLPFPIYRSTHIA